MPQFMQPWSVAQQEQIAQRLSAMRTPFPFTALVGQDEMKLALLLNAVSPQIAGVLVRGEKGTAKSTAVRALQTLLPEITVVKHCAFGCDPSDTTYLCQSCAEHLERREVLAEQQRAVRLVELPLGATEDRVIGTMDLERAIKDGIRQFEPGLLAAAHRGILYIDEVNLLPDHLVDALLDAAATGINVVEREGISFIHPARFLLIGTMNPEEGDLRPQLLDRFGLSVDVHGLKDPLLRTEVMKRRMAFESNPVAFHECWKASEAATRAQIDKARRFLPQVVVPESILRLIAHICIQFDVEGLRADITIYKAAAALAALEGRCLVTEQDVQRVASMALSHRQRRQAFEQPGLDQRAIENLINEYQPPELEQQEFPSTSPQHASTPANGGEQAYLPQESTKQTGNSGNSPSEQHERIIPPGTPTAVATLTLNRAKTKPRWTLPSLPQAARVGTSTLQARGRVVAARQPAQRPSSLALAATLRAAALHQQRRRTEHAPHEEERIWLERWDILEPVRQHKCGTLILFAVDASGSMAARKRMATTKGAVLALLRRAYQERDHVGLLQFRGVKATLLLPPTNSTSRASHSLAHLPTGGRTPLASGLRLALRTLHSAKVRDSQQQAILVLITDGRANVADPDAAHGTHTNPLEDAMAAARELRSAGVSALVIDTEEGPIRTGLACQLAQELGGSSIELATLEATPIADAVHNALGRRRNFYLS